MHLAREVLGELLDGDGGIGDGVTGFRDGRRRDRSHVKQKDTSSMGPDDEFVLERVNREVVHGSSRKARAKRLPRAASVRRDVNSQVGSHVKHFRASWIFPNDVH